MGIVEALLPNCTDHPLDELANAIFIDDTVLAPVSPVDQLLMAFARRLLVDDVLGHEAVVQLPRAKHRSALLLAIVSHLLCRQPPGQLKGPVVLIGFDVDLADQLRHLEIQNRRRMGLNEGNPLSAHRLTRIGEVRPVIGSEVRPIDDSLVYFNTRVGVPALLCRAPLIVLDVTSIATATARTRVLEWSLERGPAAIVAVGDIGDDGLIDTMSDAGVVPTVLTVTEHVAEELVASFGKGTISASTLSSTSVLQLPRTKVVLHRIQDDDANEAVTRASDTMKGRPKGPIPPELDLPLNMMRNGMRLASRVGDYKAACVDNTRPGELPSVRRLARLEQRDSYLTPHWRHWRTARLGALVAGVQALWRVLEEGNPKLTGLWRVLDDLDRTTTGSVVIRCHSRAAVAATLSSLSSGERTDIQSELWNRIGSRVKVTTFKERFAAGSVEAQVLTGAPPPWLFSLFLGVEAKTTHVLCYEVEIVMLRAEGQRWAERASGWQHALCRSLRVDDSGPINSPIEDTAAIIGGRVVSVPNVPGLELAEVLDLATKVFDPPETESTPVVGGSSTGGARTCFPVLLQGGGTWWCVDDHEGATPVVTITAGGPETRAVRDLRSGDRIIVPAGEGTDSIHARLVAASRSNDDVKALDLILSQFRSAARVVMAGRTRADAIDQVRIAGAKAYGQLPFWASGSTIAPQEPGDVAAVFRAAGKPCPDLGLIYAVANKLRSLGRMLGHFVAAISSGRGEDATGKLRALVGPVADELLDEFVVAVVDRVGEPQTMPGSIAGRVR
ncbi:MAG: hypothetical protein ABSA31_02300 [Acidimicrobiales bacterium]